MIRIRNILYPTDFSSYSNQAYFHAVALAEGHGATLTVMFVYRPGPPGRDYWMEQLQQIHPSDARIAVRHVLREGDPATEIVRYADEIGVDLIVMGTHGRKGLERFLAGSVAEKVIREASCSVLVVKLPKGITAGERARVDVALLPA